MSSVRFKSNDIIKCPLRTLLEPTIISFIALYLKSTTISTKLYKTPTLWGNGSSWTHFLIEQLR